MTILTCTIRISTRTLCCTHNCRVSDHSLVYDDYALHTYVVFARFKGGALPAEKTRLMYTDQKQKE